MNYISIVLMVLILLIVLVFIFRTKLGRVMSIGVQFLFFFSVFLALSTILFPFLYEKIADFALKEAGVYQTVQEWDDESIVNTIADTKNTIFDTINNIFNDDLDEDVVTEDSHFFEENLYPIILNITLIILRFSVGFVALIGMMGGLYVSYTAIGVTETRLLRKKYLKLEKRIVELEAESASK